MTANLFRKSFPLVSCFFLLISSLSISSCNSSSIHTRQPLLETAFSECVILIHGLGRTHRSMGEMETKLREAGYITVNLEYPSRSKTIEQIASEHVPEALNARGAYDSWYNHPWVSSDALMLLLFNADPLERGLQELPVR